MYIHTYIYTCIYIARERAGKCSRVEVTGVRQSMMIECGDIKYVDGDISATSRDTGACICIDFYVFL